MRRFIILRASSLFVFVIALLTAFRLTSWVDIGVSRFSPSLP